MGKKIILPWEADMELPESIWAEGFLRTKIFGVESTTKAPQECIDQIIKISTHLIKYNQWGVCLSSSPYYMQKLYPYIASTWVYSKRDTVEIMEADELLKGVFNVDNEKKEIFNTKILSAGLLILPYIESTQIGISKARNTIATLLMKRKLQGKPVLIDLKVRTKPTDGAEVAKELSVIQDTLGESSIELFKSKTTKVFLVSQIKKGLLYEK